MKNFIFKTAVKVISTLILFFWINISFAQCDTIANNCSKHLSKEFISDGQQYRALLIGDQIAEFHVTLYGGTTYRIAGCTGFEDGNLIYSVYDKERNLIFTNKDYANSPFWNFKVENTFDCIIEAQLNPDYASSGCAVLLIGFKQ